MNQAMPPRGRRNTFGGRPKFACPALSEPARVPRRRFCLLRSRRHDFKLCVVGGFGLGGRYVADRFEEASVVEPVDPFEGYEFDRFEALPGTTAPNDLGFVESVDSLREGVIVAALILSAKCKVLINSIDTPISNRDILRSAVAMVNQAALTGRATIVDGLLQRIQHELGMR